MTTLAADVPCAAAIFALLQDATLQAALGGRLSDSLPANTPRPCALYVMGTNTNESGFGPSVGPVRIDFRTYVWSDLGSLSEAKTINGIIVDLLKDALLTIAGFQQCGAVRYWETPEPQDAALNGVLVHEVTSNFTLWVEAV